MMPKTDIITTCGVYDLWAAFRGWHTAYRVLSDARVCGSGVDGSGLGNIIIIVIGLGDLTGGS